METMAAILLILFCGLGVFDGLYFHIYKYKLHQLPEARREHLIHTARAFVFVPMSLLIFVFNSSGILLYLGITMVALDLVLELLDILEERVSRQPLGGISSSESAIHVFASSVKFAAIVLVLASKNPEAYALSARFQLETNVSPLLSVTGFVFAIGCLGGGLYSVVLKSEPRKCAVTVKS